MTMKLLLVDNKTRDLAELLDALSELDWEIIHFPLVKGAVGSEQSLRGFLKSVCDGEPDIVVLDAALTDQEEKLLDEIQLEMKEVYENMLSGFKYCRVLAKERLGIPIVFLTKYSHGDLARIAMRIGADRVLVKSKNKYLVREIEELIKTRIPHDPTFFWFLKEKLKDRPDMWNQELLKKALVRFYINSSDVRRFSLFTASLRDVFSFLFNGNIKAEKKLLLSLVKGQVVLSLVDPSLRDHVRHTGNVFWLGYILFHEISEFEELFSLIGKNSKNHKIKGSTQHIDQFMYAWTLASLFHDLGYMDEHKNQLTRLISSILPDANLTSKDLRNEPSWRISMHLLKDFVTNYLGEDHFLYHFIDTMITSFNCEMDCHDEQGPKLLIDHGLISAYRLISMIPLEDNNSQKKYIVLHAALAIACHNYVDIITKWKFSDKCKGVLSIEELPLLSLLAFCDNIQTWNRESGMDPALSRSETSNDLFDRLVLTDSAYILESEINEFLIHPKSHSESYELKIKLRYFVEGFRGIEDLLESKGQEIQRWIDSDKLINVCKMTGISSILHGQIIYELPMMFKPKKVFF